jgi:ABC-type thiamine transport system substrate-binding protein
MTMGLPLALGLVPALLSLVLAPLAQAEETGEVNVYSYRQPSLIEPLLKEFTDQTRIKVNVLFAEKGLIERIQAEGANSPADLLLTVDVGNLTQATEGGICPAHSVGERRSGCPARLSVGGQQMGRAHAPRTGCLRIKRAREAGRDYL